MFLRLVECDLQNFSLLFIVAVYENICFFGSDRAGADQKSFQNLMRISLGNCPVFIYPRLGFIEIANEIFFAVPRPACSAMRSIAGRFRRRFPFVPSRKTGSTPPAKAGFFYF